MAQTPSTMLELGTAAPAIKLPDVTTGKLWQLCDYDDQPAYLVMFICNHCPFVIHVADELKRIGDDYMAKNVVVVAISSNDAEKYPADAPEKMAEEKKLRGYSFPYLFDETQQVAKAYRAACTPDFYLFDGEKRLRYRGQMDGARPGNSISVDGHDLRAALDAILSGQPVAEQQRPSIGCNIKWKPENAPSYFVPKS